MKRKDIRVSKNVTLTMESIEIVLGYSNRTKKNFSKTLDIIVKEWDNISLALARLQEKERLKAKEVKEKDEIKN